MLTAREFTTASPGPWHGPSSSEFVPGAVWPEQRDGGAIVLGNLTVDIDAFQARLNDRPVCLTSQELEVLLLLAFSAGRLVTHERIGRALWGNCGKACARNIGVVITRLRTKLASAHPYRIETVRKRGFMLTVLDD